MISIIIPHHKETIEDMKPLLSSIDNQLGINFNNIEILICNDTDYVILDFSLYTNIKSRIHNVYSSVKNNIGMNRQAGLDNAKGDYVLFCDADDALYSALSLHTVFKLIQSGKDYYNFQFVREVVDGTFDIEPYNTIWIFGKLIKLNFLRKHNIHWTPEIGMHEDTYLNLLIRGHCPTYEQSEDLIYVWRFNSNSITRSNNGEYFFTTIGTLLDTATLALIKLSHIVSKEQITMEALDYLLFVYWIIQTDKQLNDGKYSANMEQACVPFIKKFNLKEFCLNRGYWGFIGDRLTKKNKYSAIPYEGFVTFIERTCKEV